MESALTCNFAMTEVVSDRHPELDQLHPAVSPHESSYDSPDVHPTAAAEASGFGLLPLYHPVLDLRGDEIVRLLQPTPRAETQRLKVFNYISSLIKNVLDVDVR